ncbi:unnamed protein product [Moneuplotes crassus]|uniref:Uncharacterized protein n=1 Tax=Euplotes crassus TaxID=5936 RepID=A0AAD1UC85_EUPCR|nr:unnamed protein product [Moneuplotes crassus]
MPKLFRNKGQYSFTSKYKGDGNVQYDVVSTEKYNLSSPSPGDVDEDSKDNTVHLNDNTSPSRWLSKNVFDSSMNENDCTFQPSLGKNFTEKSLHRETSGIDVSQTQKFPMSQVVSSKSPRRVAPTDKKLSNRFLKKCMATTFKSYNKRVCKNRTKKRTNRVKYRNDQEFAHSQIQSNKRLDIGNLREGSTPKLDLSERLTLSKSSKFLNKQSISKAECSTAYSKSRQREGRKNMNQLKIKARKTLRTMNSCEKVAPSLAMSDIPDEVASNSNKTFMDDYYASNGYFSYSNNLKEVREKDNYQDRLQTFIDEKLLEVASQISVKKELEQEKSNNIDKLHDLRDNINYLHSEGNHILSAKTREEAALTAKAKEVESLQKQLDQVRNSYARVQKAWKMESKFLYKHLQDSTDSYNKAENDYQVNRQDIRMEMHDDKNLIHQLQTSIEEGDNIFASLKDKAKYSKTLERERNMMMTDRALLLKDLCTHEKLKYKKNLKTLPAFIEVPHDKGKPLQSVTSRIRHKLFSHAGKMRKKSPDLYTKRHSHVKQQMRLSAEKKNRLSSMTRPSIGRSAKKPNRSFLNNTTKI